LNDIAPDAARLDLGGERVLLTLRAPVTCRGAFGERTASRIILSADDPSALCAAIARRGTASPCGGTRD
jgi:hypothetical protein